MSDDDAAPAPADNLRREPAEIECSSCGAVFEHVKKGALPKRCPDCRESKTAGEAPPKRSRPIEQLETNMRVQLAALATVVHLADPWLGQHCMKNVERAAKAHANLAANNPKLRAKLEKGVELAGYGPVIVFWATFLVPIVAHYRQRPEPGRENVVNFARGPSHAV